VSKVITLCGIVGISIKNNESINELIKIDDALKSIKHRGPDNQSSKKCSNNLVLGHARLSIIDLSNSANQPIIDKSERYTLVFNGEIYNYKLLRIDLIKLGYIFQTDSDTEVLLNLLIEYKEAAIEMLNGFFAFAFYDSKEDKLLLARDRFGIKPLHFYQDDNKFIFASEIRPFFKFDIDKTLNNKAIDLLFTLTYIPAPESILRRVKKAIPGCYYIYSHHKLIETKYYKPTSKNQVDLSYEEAKKGLKSKLNKAIELRMVSDVPLGSFLSGGVDSSIVSALAKDYKTDLQTYSVGFEHPFFDESKYADDVVNKIGSNHTKIMLGASDFKQNFEEFIDKIDEPFADSSAYAVYLLTKKTKENVTVALSGDGADEVFAGYRKHYAEWMVRNSSSLKKNGVKTISKLLSSFGESRSGKVGDINRKIQKLARGYNFSTSQRYWNWASFIDESDKNQLLKKKNKIIIDNFIHFESVDLNEVLIQDQKFILPNDMLSKVDMMSMANSLEVRTPFLDHNLVNYVNTLPSDFKVNKNGRKQILIDTFKDRLPQSVYNRQKKGFEIPLQSWIGNNINEILFSELFSESYIKNQGLFDYDYISELRNNWSNPKLGDKIYLIWTLIIFQNWWNKYIDGKKD
jgi:asparagine synthase (glutamine-hydrolysing)